MAIHQNSYWHGRPSGNDTNGGGATLTGVTFASNLAGSSANTASPVVSSATYNFVSDDVGHWVVITGGSNWIPGAYKIASVASNQATLEAAVGEVVLSTSNIFYRLNNRSTDAAGAATTASPTGGSWFIDYNQKDSKNTAGSNISVTDGVTAGTTTITSATANFQVSIIGNIIYVEGGTGSITGGWYQVTARASTTSITVDRATGLTTGTGVTLNIGGALASPGQLAANQVANNDAFFKSGTYTFTSSSSNVSGGRPTIVAGATTQASRWTGFENRPFDYTGVRPTFDAGAVTGITMVTASGTSTFFDNFVIDCQGGTTMTGITSGGNRSGIWRTKVIDSTVNGISITSDGMAAMCEVTGASGTSAFSGSTLGNFIYCEAYDCTTVGFILTGSQQAAIGCIADTCTGASSDGFQGSGRGHNYSRCIAYGCGRHGFNMGQNGATSLDNCIAESNGGWGYTNSTIIEGAYLFNCAGYNNTSGDISNSIFPNNRNFITGTGSFFTDAANGDFTLNNTAGAGAALRAAGFPGVMMRGIGTGYADIGLFQHQDSGGGGPIGRLVMVRAPGSM